MKGVPVIDFETEGIQARPHYPPKPVGVAIKYPGKKAKYYAWGHPTKNNCTKDQAKVELEKAWKFTTAQHNSKFDLDIAQVHFGLPWPAADKFHDTMILAYLHNPHNKQIGLKQLSAQMHGREAEEQDELREWVLKNVKEAKPSTWGGYIALAPGDLVGKYACADVEMTESILDDLLPKVLNAEMGAAYHREKELLQILNGMEERGIPVDVERLNADLTKYLDILGQIDTWIKKYLKAPDATNLDSPKELADALDKSGKAGTWNLTPTGKRSTSKDSIKAAINDEILVMMLDYRSTLANYVQNFMGPWVAMSASGGKIYTQWHSTKQEKDGGTRTGRLSSTPNLQNVPSDERWKEANERFAKLYKKYKWLPTLPHIRSYIAAPKGFVLLDRDYSQQEPRTLAHFEDGVLCEAYKADPRMDIYLFGIKVVFEQTGVTLHEDPKFARKIMKTIILAIMYGLGLGKLAERLGITVEEAKKFRDAILRALPGVKMLTSDLQKRGRAGEFMRTWGGRVYYSEPSKIINGRLQEYAYKLTNYLIQGSSADMTKEAMCRYERSKKYGELLISVHDELIVIVPEKHWKTEMKLLKHAMDSVELDAPLVSDGCYGQAWGTLEDCE
jgi:DNA polymerase-1